MHWNPKLFLNASQFSFFYVDVVEWGSSCYMQGFCPFGPQVMTRHFIIPTLARGWAGCSRTCTRQAGHRATDSRAHTRAGEQGEPWAMPAHCWRHRLKLAHWLKRRTCCRARWPPPAHLGASRRPHPWRDDVCSHIHRYYARQQPANLRCQLLSMQAVARAQT